MLLQRIIAKFVMLAMLFTVTMSSVGAVSVEANSHPSHCLTYSHKVSENHCCHNNNNHYSSDCSTSDSAIKAMNHSDHCCDNSDCHNISSVPFAILSDNNTLLTPSSTALFTEPDGEQYHFHELILRPPMSA